jgi:hypothetical protein
VIVSWPRLAGAEGYSVRVRGTDGRKEMWLRSAKQRSVRILRVAPSTKLTVRVAGWIGTETVVGRARVGTVGAVKVRRGRRG